MNLSDIIKTKQSLEQTKKLHCRECTYCDRVFVPSYISDSKILLLGEAPGKTEAEKGAPFVGESGKLLRKILDEVGFDSERVTYVNTVKCHPPENETPDKKVVALCSTLFLQNEIHELKPEYVILVGSIALNSFFPGELITNKAGSILMKDNIKFFPILHPSYCLRNPTAIPRLRKDLKKAHLVINGEYHSDKRYKVVRTIDELKSIEQKLLESEFITFDVETNGILDIWDDKILIWTIGFGVSSDEAYSIPIYHPDVVNIEFREQCILMCRRVLQSKVKKIAHNAKFDIKVLKGIAILVVNLYADTMVMAYLLDEHRNSYGLKALSSEYLDGYSHFWSKDLEELGLYNCEDCGNTYGLFQLFLSKLKEFPGLFSLFELIVNPMLLVIIEMEGRGVNIDLAEMKKISLLLTKKVDALRIVVNDEYPESRGVNLGSPKQLQELFYEKLKYPIIKRTKTGISTDAEVLEELAKRGYLLPKYMLKIRKIEKFLSTYIDNLPKEIRADGRIHGEFHLTAREDNTGGTASGRLSSSNPNLQNIPTDKSIKRMFSAIKGYLLLNADFSQAELRVVCSIANERNMIQAYCNGLDIHKLTASKILNKLIANVTADDRQKAKGVNFGFVYGASAEGFQVYAKSNYGLELSLNECVKFRELFFSSYPALEVWYKSIENELRRFGFIQYPTGRIARFPGVKGLREIPHDILRKGINYPVQGSSSDIVLYTIVRLHEFIKRSNLLAYIIITVHDSILIELKEGLQDVIISEIQRICREDIPRQFSWLRVPMIFDFSLGENWGDVKKI